MPDPSRRRFRMTYAAWFAFRVLARLQSAVHTAKETLDEAKMGLDIGFVVTPVNSSAAHDLSALLPEGGGSAPKAPAIRWCWWMGCQAEMGGSGDSSA